MSEQWEMFLLLAAYFGLLVVSVAAFWSFVWVISRGESQDEASRELPEVPLCRYTLPPVDPDRSDVQS